MKDIQDCLKDEKHAVSVIIPHNVIAIKNIKFAVRANSTDTFPLRTYCHAQRLLLISLWPVESRPGQFYTNYISAMSY